MLDHCDLLAAIWDGRESAGRGGTREIVDGALRRDIPVIWINSVSAEPLSLWDGHAAHRLRLRAEDFLSSMQVWQILSLGLSPLQRPTKKCKASRTRDCFTFCMNRNGHHGRPALTICFLVFSREFRSRAGVLCATDTTNGRGSCRRCHEWDCSMRHSPTCC